MTISASEISDLIKQKIEGVDLDAQTKTTGSILECERRRCSSLWHQRYYVW